MNPVIYKDGIKRWLNIKSLLHRTDGKPEKSGLAIGYKAWYLNGKLHRIDGPAVEWSNGHKYWYLNGILHRTDGPAIEWSDRTKSWYLNGVWHRTDGPAVERPDGYKSWYLNGVRHRTDGPAIEYSNGTKSWFLNGKELSKDLFLKLTGPVQDLPLYLGQNFDLFISQRIRNSNFYE